MMNILDLVLPPSCVACRREGFLICVNCRKDIFANRYFICPLCRRRDVRGRLDKNCRKETGLTRFLGAPLSYEDERVRKIIHVFKYRRVKALADPLAEMLIEFLNGTSNGEDLFRSTQGRKAPRGPRPFSGGDLFNPPIKRTNDSPLKSRKRSSPLLVPIPMNSFKERERGFNQATELAKVLTKYYDLELNTKLLKKIKNTGNQADIKNKEDRIKNIEGAFRCENPKLVENKIVILVDDVYTTGATMRDCARALRKDGAREVWGVTIAR